MTFQLGDNSEVTLLPSTILLIYTEFTEIFRCCSYPSDANYFQFLILRFSHFIYSQVGISVFECWIYMNTAIPKKQITAIQSSDSQAMMELTSPSLKKLYVEEISLDKFVLEADNLESLHLKDSTVELFELISKGSLKHIRMDDVSIIHLDIGETTDLLEVLDVSDFTIMWPKFYQMISRATKLRRLRLWGIVFDLEDEVMDLETIVICFPKLNHLSLSYDMRDGLLQHVLRGSSLLENVVVLKLGSTVIKVLSHCKT